MIGNYCNIGILWIASIVLKNSSQTSYSSTTISPPIKGLEVLRGLLELVAADQIQRPRMILGISSSSAANQAMEYAGADGSIGKFQLANHEVWKN